MGVPPMSDDGEALVTQLRQLVGTEITGTATEPVGRAFIRQFALAIEDDNPLYHDEEYARETRYGGIVAPPTYVCETWQYFPGDLNETGAPAQRIRLPVGTEIRGGNEYEFFQPFRPDDIITARWKVVDVYQKQGGTGRLIFLVYDITYTNQRGERLAVNRERLIYQLPRQQ